MSVSLVYQQKLLPENSGRDHLKRVSTAPRGNFAAATIWDSRGPLPHPLFGHKNSDKSIRNRWSVVASVSLPAHSLLESSVVLFDKDGKVLWHRPVGTQVPQHSVTAWDRSHLRPISTQESGDLFIERVCNTGRHCRFCSANCLRLATALVDLEGRIRGR